MLYSAVVIVCWYFLLIGTALGYNIRETRAELYSGLRHLTRPTKYFAVVILSQSGSAYMSATNQPSKDGCWLHSYAST